MLSWKLKGKVSKCESGNDFADQLIQANETKIIQNIMYIPDVLDLRRSYRVEGVHFKNVSFKSTELCNFKFRDCTFEKCLFIGAKFRNCAFHKSSFFETNFAYCEFQDTYVDPKIFENIFTIDEANLATHFYQSLLDNFQNDSQIEYARQAEYLFYKWRHILTNERIRYLKKLKSRRSEEDCAELEQYKKQSVFYFILARIGYGIKICPFVITISSVFTFFVIFNYLAWFCYAIDSASAKNIETVILYTFYTFASYGATPYAATSSIGVCMAIGQGIIGWIIVGTGLAMIIKKIVR